MIIYLIRHGISKANEARLVTGTTSDTLSDKGKLQTERLSRWLHSVDLKFERLITSQWRRAQQTAHCLWPDANWEVDTRVGETDAGVVADMPLTEFTEKYPDFYTKPTNSYPCGESHLELNERIVDWLSEQLNSTCNRLVLVTHSGPISCILQHMLNIDMSMFPAFLPSHASLTVTEMEKINGECVGKILSFASGPIENLSIFPA